MEKWQDQRDALEELKRGLSPEARATVERIEGVPLNVLLRTIRYNLLDQPPGALSRAEIRAVLTWTLRRAMTRRRVSFILRIERLVQEVERRDFGFLLHLLKREGAPSELGG